MKEQGWKPPWLSNVFGFVPPFDALLPFVHQLILSATFDTVIRFLCLNFVKILARLKLRSRMQQMYKHGESTSFENGTQPHPTILVT